MCEVGIDYKAEAKVSSTVHRKSGNAKVAIYYQSNSRKRQEPKDEKM